MITSKSPQYLNALEVSSLNNWFVKHLGQAEAHCAKKECSHLVLALPTCCGAIPPPSNQTGWESRLLLLCCLAFRLWPLELLCTNTLLGWGGGRGGIGERTRPLNVPSHYNKGYFCLTEQFILNMSHWISSIIKHCCLLYSKGRLPAPIPPSEILLLPSNNLFFIPK